MIIKEENGKIIFEEISDGPFRIEFNSINEAKTSLMNMNRKFERYLEGFEGYEGYSWIGGYITVPKAIAKEAQAIMTKYIGISDKEIQELIKNGHDC